MPVVTVVSIIIMVIGILGMIHPLFPGTLMVILGPILYVIFNGFNEISIPLFIIMIILTILGLFVDNIGSMLGTKKFGASKKALVGALIGGIVGLIIFNIIGFLIGQFIGVIIVEIYYGKEFKKSLKAGLGVFIGYVTGYMMKLALGGVILLLFVIRILG